MHTEHFLPAWEDLLKFNTTAYTCHLGIYCATAKFESDWTGPNITINELDLQWHRILQVVKLATYLNMKVTYIH